jgi:hypothetical protein
LIATNRTKERWAGSSWRRRLQQLLLLLLLLLS